MIRSAEFKFNVGDVVCFRQDVENLTKRIEKHGPDGENHYSTSNHAHRMVIVSAKAEWFGIDFPSVQYLVRASSFPSDKIPFLSVTEPELVAAVAEEAK